MADGKSVRSADLGISDPEAHVVDRPEVRRWRELCLRLTAACQLILVWIDRSKQRRQLAALSETFLKDLNISHADVEAECRKRFWQQ
jgi:uncharacterized protein YjiS (DUF1127 family)